MSVLGGGGSSEFAYKMLMFSAIIMIVLPMLINIYCPKISSSMEPNYDLEQLETQFYDFTGSNPSSESVWALTGIYTPYGVGADGNASTDWGYTADGWLYGARIVNYSPSQYGTDPYKSSYNSGNGLYYYPTASTTVNKHSAGDLYTSVVMDANKKSNIFFTESGKVTDGQYYYYEYNGYRYAFQPLEESTTVDADGNNVAVVPNTSSLSLIWYDYYGNSGVAGQLIISGSDSGVAYLTAQQIVSAFNSNTNTSKFTMTFNGISMNIYIRIDPTYTSSGLSVEDCYKMGYWSIMVSSRSVDVGAYNSASYEFNASAIFDTMIDLLTFNTSDYGLSGVAGTLASLTIVVPLFIGLVCIGMSFYPVLIFAGIWAVLSAWSHGLFG